MFRIPLIAIVCLLPSFAAHASVVAVFPGAVKDEAASAECLSDLARQAVGGMQVSCAVYVTSAPAEEVVGLYQRQLGIGDDEPRASTVAEMDALDRPGAPPYQSVNVYEPEELAGGQVPGNPVRSPRLKAELEKHRKPYGKGGWLKMVVFYLWGEPDAAGDTPRVTITVEDDSMVGATSRYVPRTTITIIRVTSPREPDDPRLLPGAP